MSASIVKWCAAVVVSAVVLSQSSFAQATVIVADSFSGVEENTPLTGRTPETNVPSSSYVGVGNTTYWGTPIIYPWGPEGGYASMAVAVGEALSIASSGTYEKPQKLGISATLHVGNLGGGDVPFRGLGLGFYSSVPTGDVNQDFAGLMVGANGDLSLFVHPAWNSSAVSTISYGSGWDANAWHTLAYAVDTVSGSVCDVVFDGVSRVFSANTTDFVYDEYTDYAAFIVCGNNAGQSGAVDNFVVTNAIPEPTTTLLLATGVIGLLAHAWRKRN